MAAIVACPKCKVPVRLGGGKTMQNDSVRSPSSAAARCLPLVSGHPTSCAQFETSQHDNEHLRMPSAASKPALLGLRNPASLVRVESSSYQRVGENEVVLKKEDLIEIHISWTDVTP